MGVVMEKPKFDREQLIKASDVPRQFASIRKQAKDKPLVVTENGEFDTVILDYHYFEEIYSRLMELEEQNEILILGQRLDDLEKSPDSAVNWRDIRRSGR